MKEEIKPSDQSRQIEIQEQGQYRVVNLYDTDYLIDGQHVVVLQASRAPSVEDMKGIAKKFNALDAAIPALKGVAIMLNTELAKYESEPWAQRVRAALSAVDSQ